MKIHHVLDTLAIGGAEILVVNLAKFQKAAGHDVYVHTVLRDGPLAADLKSCAIPVFGHRSTPRLLLLTNLYRVFRSERPDVVHCHNISPTVYGALAAKLAGTPAIVSTRHGLSTHDARRERKFWFAARYCRCVAAVSDAALRDLASDPWAVFNKLVTIYNGAQLPPAKPETTSGIVKRGLALISVGRLTWQKDFPCLLRALALARREVFDLELWILGEGAERGLLEGLIDELGIRQSVKLLGMSDNVGHWLNRADVFVLASVSEGLPISLLEAMSAGIPAIVTDAGGMPEVVNASGGGLVVPQSQPDALAKAIVSLARTRERLPAMGRAAQEHYLRHFTLERMAEQYMEVYVQGAAN